MKHLKSVNHRLRPFAAPRYHEFMAFGLGKPLLVLGFIAVLGGGWLATHRPPPRGQLSLWVFAASHDREYEAILHPRFEATTGISVDVQLVPARAMEMRLAAFGLAPGSARETADAIEIPASNMGLYLRPPVDQISFLPLNDWLIHSGWRVIASLDAPGRPGWAARYTVDRRVYRYNGQRWAPDPARAQPDAWIDRLLPTRLAAATKGGQIFGIPHDVHPVALAFREDLFREAGVPLMSADGSATFSTWPEFRERCITFQKYWKAHGEPDRHAMQLPPTNSGILSMLLSQRHVNLVAATEDVTYLNDPRVAETLAFYVQMVAGPDAIGSEGSADTGLEVREFVDGHVCALLMPDWKVDSFRRYAPQLTGKMRLLPMPAFETGDAPTASYGGTLICIPRECPRPEAAWRLIEYLYLSPEGLEDRMRLGILPPLPEEWDRPEYRHPDPYFGGQPTLAIYADLARRAPANDSTSTNTMALLTLGYVQSVAVAFVNAHGADGLEERCQQWLDAAAADLQRRIEHARYQP